MNQIPQAKAVIHFARDSRNERVIDVELHERSKAPDVTSPRSLPKTLGAYSNDWCVGGDPRATPEGVYIAFEHYGFDTDATRLKALSEFGKIAECQWARIMHAALLRQLKAESS